MINNMDERILAELEIKKLNEMKTENKLSEIQLNKLNEWIISIEMQIADFDIQYKQEIEDDNPKEEEDEKEVDNEDAPFHNIDKIGFIQHKESVQSETPKHLQNTLDDWMSSIRPLRPFQYYLGGNNNGNNN